MNKGRKKKKEKRRKEKKRKEKNVNTFRCINIFREIVRYEKSKNIHCFFVFFNMIVFLSALVHGTANNKINLYGTM